MFAMGAPPAALGLLSVAAPMYLLRFLSNVDPNLERNEPEVVVQRINITLPGMFQDIFGGGENK